MEANKLLQWAEKYHIDEILNIANTHEALLNLKSLNLSHKKLNTLPGVLEISCQSDRILNSKGQTDERGVQF